MIASSEADMACSARRTTSTSWTRITLRPYSEPKESAGRVTVAVRKFVPGVGSGVREAEHALDLDVIAGAHRHPIANAEDHNVLGKDNGHGVRAVGDHGDVLLREPAEVGGADFLELFDADGRAGDEDDKVVRVLKTETNIGGGGGVGHCAGEVDCEELGR